MNRGDAVFHPGPEVVNGPGASYVDLGQVPVAHCGVYAFVPEAMYAHTGPNQHGGSYELRRPESTQSVR